MDSGRESSRAVSISSFRSDTNVAHSRISGPRSGFSFVLLLVRRHASPFLCLLPSSKRNGTKRATLTSLKGMLSDAILGLMVSPHSLAATAN